MKEIIKKWGKEIWIVNDPEYCGKFLEIKRGAQSSMHYHKTKKETFFPIEGEITLIIKLTRPVTIEPTLPHKFIGETDATILEISTHHDEDDVVRLEESKNGVVCPDKV